MKLSKTTSLPRPVLKHSRLHVSVVGSLELGFAQQDPLRGSVSGGLNLGVEHGAVLPLPLLLDVALAGL